MGLDVIFWGVMTLTLLWCLSGAYDGQNRAWRENFHSKDTMVFKTRNEDEQKS